MEFRATQPGDLDEIVSLMRRVFRSPPATPSLNPELLRWKYYVPRRDWSAPRSFGLFSAGALVAHGCLWPVRLATPGGIVEAPCLVDWASDPKYIGMGVLLVRRLAERYPVLLSIGGSRDTRSIMPKIGFRAAGELSLYAKVLSPFAQFRARGRYAPREFARLARNTAWCLEGRSGKIRDWTVSPFAGDADMAARLPENRSAVSVLDEGTVKYFSECPSPAIVANLLRSQRGVAGDFVYCASGGQARIVALRVESRLALDWNPAVGAAVQAVGSLPGICEVAAAASGELLAGALLANGFRRRETCPVFVRDPNSVLSGTAGCELNWIDDDTSYLWYPDNLFLT